VGLHPVALAREAIERHQRLVDEHQRALEAGVVTATGTWYAPRLRRVRDNLRGNAVEYSPGGGTGTVRVALADSAPGPERAEDIPMPVTARRGAVVTVADQGSGIRLDDLPHAFERFRGGAHVGPAVSAGSGLSSVRQIVAQPGGTVSIASREGVRTTVTVWLPVEPPAPGAV
jgi:signal transduction histidine kinase